VIHRARYLDPDYRRLRVLVGEFPSRGPAAHDGARAPSSRVSYAFAVLAVSSRVAALAAARRIGGEGPAVGSGHDVEAR